MKVFLTGGTGFIGHSLTPSMLGRGWEVVALVRRADSPQVRWLSRIGARCVAGDVTSRESMRGAMSGADIVVHDAAWYELGISHRARALMHSINVTGTDHVLSLALELGIPRSVHVSSVVYFGDTGPEARDETFRPQPPQQSCYVQTKAEAHELALQYQRRGLPLVIVCPGHVVGPNDHSVYGYFLRLYLNGRMPPWGFSPEMVFSPVHVDDVGEGIALAAARGRPGETYILAGDAMRLREVFDAWMTRPGGCRIRCYVPRWLARAIFAPLVPLQRRIGLPAFMSAETVAASGISYNFSSAKAERELGWTHRPGSAMWGDIIDREIALLASRQKRDLVSRLRPVERE